MIECNYWQHAAGDNNRNYVDLCLSWGVILTGPGHAGPWPECAEQLNADGLKAKKISGVRRFCEDMKDGDIVVLRIATTHVCGVGVIVGDYEWVDAFGDVDGWNLQHCRRVRWLWKPKPEASDEGKKFPVYTLKQGDTTQLLTSEKVINWIDRLNLNFKSKRKLPRLPENENHEVDFDDVSEFLFDEGVSSNSIEALSREIDELVRIAKWYKKYDNPSEFETVAYLAVPLLRAIGWTPQRMGIEWNRVDIALFSQLPRNDGNLSVVVEAKKKGNACLTAFSQAEDYAKGKKNCHRLIVTDGLRYGVFLKKKNKFELYAYFNITRLRSAYPIFGCHGVKEGLRAMTPEWNG